MASAKSANLLRICRSSTLKITRPSAISIHPHQLSCRLPSPARNQVATRWFSSTRRRDAEQAAKRQSEEVKSEDASKEQSEKEDARQKELEAKNKEIVELKDKYLRSVADFRNLQERTRRELQAGRDFAIQKFARDLIESVDNLDLALSNVSADKLNLQVPTDGSEDPNKELKQLHGGLKMTESVLMNTLKKHGLERFDPSEKGDKFDPNIHEATFQTPQPDKEDGICFYTTQKGFTLNGRILRAAKVGVVKNS